MLWKKSQTPMRMSTGRLLLDLLRPRHASVLFRPLQEASLYTFIPQQPPGSVDALRAKYTTLARMTSKEDDEVWLNWIALKKGDSKPVGVFEASVFLDGRADIAYFVFRPFRRRGYARECCGSIIECLAERFRVDEFVARIDSKNQASIALVESMGFIRNKLVCEAQRFKGRVSDEYEYRLERAIRAR